MTTTPAQAPVEPSRWLVNTRDLRVVWMLRILVNLGAASGVTDRTRAVRFARIAKRLKLAGLVSSDPKDRERACSALELTLAKLEGRMGHIQLPKVLVANLSFLASRFSLNRTECLILALAVCLRHDTDLYDVAKLNEEQINTPRTIATILRVRLIEVGRALEPFGRLRRSGLIRASSGGNIADCLEVRRGGLRKLATNPIRSVEELLSGILATGAVSALQAEDYAHLSPGFDVLERLIRDAITKKRTGVNVLVYGAPGTGKTELIRVVARVIGVPLFEVAYEDEDGSPLHPRDRLGAAATGLFLLGRRRTVMCFDEIDAIFNDGSDFVGKPSTAVSAKAWVNHLLESNQVPVFWISNSVRDMDPAFVRRFDLAIHLDSPPQQQRLRLLERECGSVIPREQLHALSRVGHITPALVTRASSVARRVGKPGEYGQLLESVLDGVLRAQGHIPLTQALQGTQAENFDPAFCNANEDLTALAAGLSASKAGRICLYGPPGTGKTAFGRWISDVFDMPLVLKRVSDLQSPMLGVMERNLARAFEQASREGAVLQIDELDSFLQDRRQAQRSWEVSQVNEFLTQLEHFEGMFIASTNLMDNLDQAALRRFDYKVRMDFLRMDQVEGLLRCRLKEWGIESASRSGWERLKAQKLTPGDFAIVARRHRVMPFTAANAVVDALCAEAELGRRSVSRPIGFI